MASSSVAVEEEDSMWQMLVVLLIIMAISMLLLRMYQDQNLGVGRFARAVPGDAHGAAAAAAGTRNNLLPRGFGTAAISAIPSGFQPNASQLSAVQLSLHRVLPLQNGAARTVTIPLDALTVVQNHEIFWKDDLIASSLHDLAQIADVYLFCRVAASAEDKQQMERWQRFLSLQHALVHDPKQQKRGIPCHKLLFHTSTVGKIAFVRQLEPQFHVEVEPEAAKALQPHVPRILFVTSEQSPRLGLESENVHVAESFSAYIKLLIAS